MALAENPECCVQQDLVAAATTVWVRTVNGHMQGVVPHATREDCYRLWGLCMPQIADLDLIDIKKPAHLQTPKWEVSAQNARPR
jgi:hypothetical protein